MDTICWLAVFLVLLAIEIVTLGLTTIWFAIGAIAAFIATLFHADYIIQLVLFIIVSVVTLVITRPIAIKYFNRNTIKTNVDGIIGKKVMVTKAITGMNRYGEAELNGETWTAMSRTGTFMPGDTAEIEAVEGVKLIVK